MTGPRDCTDNRAAASSIINLSDHSAQLASIIFRRHIDHLLSQYPSLHIEVLWVLGHCGIKGNVQADTLACEAAVQHSHPLFHHTITWARAMAKSKAVKEWSRTWCNSRHSDLVKQAIVRPPSSKLVPAHRHFSGSRAIHSRLIQLITGHSFIGEYYRRFVPSESPECPCGEAPIQTRDHILIDCPLYDGARSHLRRASRSLCIPTLLGTYKGLKAVARFLTSSNAFSKVH